MAITINNVRKLGEKRCLIELKNEQDKKKLMQAKSKLKNLKGETIYINDDLTNREREMQKIIRQMAKKERENGKTVKIGYRKLIVNGTEWRWNSDKEILVKEHGKK